ncbi:MAG: translocation/assembly module TamB domain-containing protein [Bacteroidota bacterium]
MTPRASKILKYSLLAFVLMIAGAAGFTQTSMFRATLKSTLYTFLAKEINADIYIGEINGNLVNGFSVDTVMMYIDGAPFVEAGKISVRYNLFDLVNNHIAIDSLTLVNPSVHLYRWKNGEWNVSHLAKNKAPKDTSESSLLVTAGRLRIVNGTFHMIDSTGEYNRPQAADSGGRSVNFANISLESLNIDLKGMYSERSMEIAVHAISYRSPKEQFILNSLSGIFRHTKQKSSLTELNIETPASHIAASVSLENIDAFAISTLSDLRKGHVSLSILPSTIRSSDAHVFIPSLKFLNGDIRFNGEMEGNFENLSVKHLNAAVGTSSIALTGSVSNIYDPKELRLNIVSEQSIVNPSDIPVLLPTYAIPDYASLGPVTVNFQFVGKPLDFLAISTIKSAAGTVTVDGQMVITEENIHYKGIFAGTDVNLEKVFATNELSSRLNTKIFIEGDGVSLDKLKGEASIQIDSSVFRNIALNTASVSLKAADRKLSGDISLTSPDGTVSANTAIDLSTNGPTPYSLTAKVRGLNLAPIMQDEYYASDLSFDLERSGTGLTLFDNASDTKIDLLHSSFRGEGFDSATIVMQWLKDTTDGDHLIVRSPIVDGEVNGRFTFADVVSGIQTHVAGLLKAYTYQRSIVDTSMVNDSTALGQRGSYPLQNTSIAYDLHMKNLKPISVFFRFPELDIVGSATGTMYSDTLTASSTGSIRISSGSYADTSAYIRLQNASLRYTLENLSLEKMISQSDPLKIDLVYSADEMKVNETSFRLMKLDLDFNKQKGRFAAATDIDTTISTVMEGDIEVSDLMNRFTFSRLEAMYQGFSLRNSTPLIVTETKDGLVFDSSKFIRADEEVIIKGSYDFGGMIALNASIKKFAVSDLFFVNTSPAFREQVSVLGGTIDAAVTVGGTAANPIIDAEMVGSGISYRNSGFGDLTAVLNYAKKRAGITIALNNDQGKDSIKTFNVKGIVPIDLAFLPIEERMDIPGMDLSIIAGNLPIGPFDIFIPEIDHLNGTADGSINITGSLKDPLMTGKILIKDGSLRLEMTGVEYLFAGTVALDSQTMTFPDLKIFNLQNEYSSGMMTVGGYIGMKGFALSEYHLTMNGELLVLNEANQSENKSFYGRLVTRTGKNGLKFEGTFERSRVIGDVLVREASITFPPTQQSVSFSNARFDDVLYMNDTATVIIDAAMAHINKPQFISATAPKAVERSFMDGFGYELTIQTEGDVSVRMVFNQEITAYEELFAKLNGKMVLKKDEVSQQLTGMINVGDGSNYKFYKEFKATGSLTFVGDPQNPQLNIIAKYQGTHCTNPDPNTGDCKEQTDMENVVVSLEITGNRMKPNLKIGLATVDRSGREIQRKGDVENDAIAFLLTSSASKSGQFREELSMVDRNKIGNQLTEAIGGTFINNLLSGVVMDFIKENNIPFVKRVEVRDVTSQTNINISGEFMSAVVNVGGKVFSDINNTNLSVQLPVLGPQNRNFMFEVERRTENYDYSVQARAIYGARLFYRFSF